MKHKSICSPVLQGGVKNMNKCCYAVHGVISKGSACTIKGVNALIYFSDFIPRPEGRGYGYTQFRYLRTYH